MKTNAAPGVRIPPPLLGWLLLLCAIRHEEACLEAKFGEPYPDYKRAVRRWF